jgi:hypothetical protein
MTRAIKIVTNAKIVKLYFPYPYNCPYRYMFTRWIWRRAGRARARLLSFIRVQVMWPHTWRMRAPSVWAGIPAPKRRRRTSRLRVSKCAGSASRSQSRKQAAVLRVLRNSGLLQQTVCASRLGLTQARVRESSSSARGGTRRLHGVGRLDKGSQPTQQLLAWGLRDQEFRTRSSSRRLNLRPETERY